MRLGFGREVHFAIPHIHIRGVDSLTHQQVEQFEDIPVLVVACLRGLRPVWPPVAARR
jgi:hypothetical protein